VMEFINNDYWIGVAVVMFEKLHKSMHQKTSF